MKVIISERVKANSVESLFIENLKELFLRVWTQQNTMSFMSRIMPLSLYYRLIRGLEVRFLYEDEYTFTADHLAVTFLKQDDTTGKSNHGVITFNLTGLKKLYGRLLNLKDYFLVNTYATVISHELVHLYIFRSEYEPTTKAKLHRFLDEYQQGLHTFTEQVYKTFELNCVKVSVYDNEKFISYALSVIGSDK